jgi:hypothetical protein
MYKYEFFDPEMSFDEEVIAALQQKQKETAEKADPQKKFELKESLSLLDKIDAKLNEELVVESKKRRKVRIRLKKRQ